MEATIFDSVPPTLVYGVLLSVLASYTVKYHQLHPNFSLITLGITL